MRSLVFFVNPKLCKLRFIKKFIILKISRVLTALHLNLFSLVITVADYFIGQAFQCAITIKYFALAVQNVLLQIQGNSLCHAIILRFLRHPDFQIIAQLKEVVNGIAAGKNNSGIIERVYFVAAELAQRHTLQVNKGFEMNSYFMMV